MAFDFRETLTNKLGPLPVWAWGALVGVAILIGVYYYNNQKKSANAENLTVTTDDVLSGLAGTPAEVTETEATFETNTSWRQKGVRLLSAQGVMPLSAQRALDKYLQGENLTAEESGYLNTVINALGLPPDGTFGIPSFDTTNPPPVSNPPRGQGITPSKPLSPPIGGLPPTTGRLGGGTSIQLGEPFFSSPVAPASNSSALAEKASTKPPATSTPKAKAPAPKPVSSGKGKAPKKKSIAQRVVEPYVSLAKSVAESVKPKSKAVSKSKTPKTSKQAGVGSKKAV